MESLYFIPLSQNWETADQSGGRVIENLQEVLARFNMFQQSAESHARAAASISSAADEFKSLTNHLESLRDSIYYPFRECARLRDETEDLLQQAEDICSEAGI
jgi:hypothetical protein